ncbi:MAG: hypothetical protein U0930_00435 [Pirellulales bacterium]
MLRKTVLGFALMLMFNGHALADIITVINHSFEDITGEVPFNEFTFGPLAGWDLYDPGNITNGGAGNTFFIGTLSPTAPMFFSSGAPDGNRVAIAFNFFGSGGLGEYGLRQSLTSTLQANTTYTLQVEIGNIASGSSTNGTPFNLDGFPGYRIDLLAGTQVIASDNNSLSGSISNGMFATSTMQFTTNSNPSGLGQALGIRLVNLNQVDPLIPNSDLEVDFDNVRLSAITAIPEPGGLQMIMVATILLSVRRGHRGDH